MAFYDQIRQKSPALNLDRETQRNILQYCFYFQDWSRLPLQLRELIATSESRVSAFNELPHDDLLEEIFSHERKIETFPITQMFLGLVDANTVGLLSYSDLLRLIEKYEVITSGYRWQLERDLIEKIRSVITDPKVRLSSTPSSTFSYHSPSINLIVPDYMNAVDAPLPEDAEDPIAFDSIGVYYYKCESERPHYYNVDFYVDFCASEKSTRYGGANNCPACGASMNPQVFLNVFS